MLKCEYEKLWKIRINYSLEETVNHPMFGLAYIEPC